MYEIRRSYFQLSVCIWESCSFAFRIS